MIELLSLSCLFLPFPLLLSSLKEYRLSQEGVLIDLLLIWAQCVVTL